MRYACKIVAGVLAVTASTTDAADLAETIKSGYDWSGFYAGAHIGHTSQRTGFEDPDFDWYGSSLYLDQDGFAYGIQGGYNWQSGATVFGVEGDFSGLSNRTVTNFAELVAIESDLSWMASLRGRAGLGIDRTLLYVTGGLALADFERSWIEEGDEFDSWPDLGDTKIGIVGGFGVENALSGRWTARFEGLVAHFDQNKTVNEIGYPMLTTDTVATGRLALNYRFGAQPDAGAALYVHGAPSDFSGFYIGGNAGGSAGMVSQTDIDFVQYGSTYDHKSQDLTGGGQLGYNVQNGAGLYGLVADFNLFANSTEQFYAPFYDIRTAIDWMASLRLKAGLVASDSLIYLTGGVAVAEFENEFDSCCRPSWDMGGTETGMIVGAGFEHKFTRNLSGFVEATFAAFPGSTVQGTEDGSDSPFRGGAEIASVRTGVNFIFGDGDLSGGVQMPLVDWSGIYAGAEASAAYHNSSLWDRDRYDFAGTYQLPSLGAGVGAHLGYDWQNGSFVYGVLADIEALTNEETDTSPTYREVVSGINWLATIRGRAGIASGQSYMYATAGLAIADVDLQHNYTPDRSEDGFNLSGTQVGWVAGLGVERALTEKVSLKLEGLYGKFGNETDTNSCDCEMVGSDDNVSLKMGLSYRFGDTW